MSSDFSNNELLHLAIDAANQKRTDSTMKYLKELVSREPNNPDALFLLGATYASLGMFDDAVKHLQQSVDVEAEFHIARFQLGLSLLALGNSDKGAIQFTQVSNSEAPEYLRCFSEGILCSLRNQKDEAIALLERGINLNNENPALNSDMEGVAEALQNMPEADQSPPEQEPAMETGSDDCAENLSTNEFLLGAYRK